MDGLVRCGNKGYGQDSPLLSHAFPVRISPAFREEDFCVYTSITARRLLQSIAVFIYFPAQLVGGLLYPQRPSGQAVVTGVVPSPPPVRALHFYRAWGSAFPLLVVFHRMLLTHALALSVNHFLCMKKSLRVCALGEN